MDSEHRRFVLEQKGSGCITAHENSLCILWSILAGIEILSPSKNSCIYDISRERSNSFDFCSKYLDC